MATLTYLVGPPASGKRTVGRELAALTGAALIDNHLINDPVLTAYGADGRTPLPDWVWELVQQIREATLTAISRAAPTVSHILTNHLGADPSDERFLRRIRGLAEQRRARFLPVWLDCPADELARRVVLPDRLERQKMRDPDDLRRLLRENGVQPAPEDALVLDTSTISATDAARRIMDWSAPANDPTSLAEPAPER